MLASLVLLACCLATTLAQDEESVVTSPPYFIAQPPQLLPFRLGEKAVISCHAEGEPRPTYTWTKNRIEYKPGEQENRAFTTKDSGTLNILNTVDLDEGDYQCTATNGFGKAVSEKVFLRKAVLNPFPGGADAPLEYPVTEGEPLTLACTPPNSFPKGSYYWSIKDRNNQRPLEYSSRRVVDLEGRLQFANVDASEDGLHDAIYSCGVQNIILRKASLGDQSKIIVNRVSGNVPQRPIIPLYISGSGTIVGKVGETTQMQCIFGGYPTPNVKWVYDETPDKVQRYSVKMHSTILEIANTQMSDAGQITCTATNANSDTAISRSFTVTVQSKPYWTRKPEHVNAAEDEDATFFCEATGEPEAKIEWFINGVPISKAAANPRRSQQKNKVMYQKLLKSDVAVLQCNASNVHGWVYANAFLNVLADPPSIIDKLPEMLKFADGKTVEIPCNVFGAPKPIISWTKDGRALTGGRFSPQPDGSLKIQKIQATDAGRYECLAKNKFGEAKDNVNVFVRRPTRIKVKPQDTTVIRGKEGKFTCEAETDPLETANMKISWRKDGQDIRYGSTQRISPNTWDNSILISGTDALDTGVYTCVASNGLDEDTASARLIVQAEPQPPTAVFMEECRTRTATVRWQPGQDNNAPILNYVIEYNTTFSPWVVADGSISSSMTEVDVPLSPWGSYFFRVLARNIIGTSLPSEPTATFCTTESAQPDKNPDNVRTLDIGPNKLVIAWSPMPPIEQNGPNMYYSVSFTPIGVDNAKENITRIEDPRVMELIHTKDVGIYQAYKIQVEAKNGHGGAREAVVPIIGFSGESFPGQVVSDFFVLKDSIKGSSATFTWTGVDESTNITQGFFRGYRISFWKRSEPDIKRRVDIIKRNVADEAAAYASYLQTDRKKRALGVPESYTVENLPPYTDVDAYIQVINKNYAGEGSNVVRFRTQQGVPGPPIQLRVAEIGPSHVIIEWTPPVEPNGILTGYDIEYQKIVKMTQETRQQRLPQVNDPAATRAKVWSLESRQKYTIYLAARTSEGKGEETFIEVTTDFPGAPGKPSMKIVAIYETGLNVTWTPNADPKYKPASAFFVQYRKTDSTEWQRTSYESDRNWANVTNLDRSYTYEVRVVASNGEKHETESDSEMVTIAETREEPASMANVSTAAWFIALMIIIAVFVLILIIVCVVRQNRGEKYPVIENELLRGQPHHEDLNFGEFTRPEEPYRKSQISLDNDIKPGVESDGDSMAAYDDDPSKFNEDGSFIGQYGAKKERPPSYEDTKAESAMSTFV